MKPSENPIQMQTQERSRLPYTLHSFAADLQQILNERGELKLAAQVRQLTIFDRRRCGDDFCATFCALPTPEGSFGPGHRNVALTRDVGMVMRDVVAGEIACVEVLDRDDVRRKLNEVLP